MLIRVLSAPPPKTRAQRAVFAALVDKIDGEWLRKADALHPLYKAAQTALDMFMSHVREGKIRLRDRIYGPIDQIECQRGEIDVFGGRLYANRVYPHVLCDPNGAAELVELALAESSEAAKQTEEPRTERHSDKKRQAAHRAIHDAFGDKIPAQDEIPNKPFCRKVREKLAPDLAPPTAKGGMSDDTILRAAGRKK